MADWAQVSGQNNNWEDWNWELVLVYMLKKGWWSSWWLDDL